MGVGTLTPYFFILKRNTMKRIIFLLLICISAYACKKKQGDYIVEGIIINAGSKETIDSVIVGLRGGYPYNAGPFLQGMNNNTPNNNYAETYTDKNGKFKLIIENEAYAYITWYKKGYRKGIVYRKGKEIYNNNGVASISRYGKHFLTIEYEAECSFFPVFKKLRNNSIDDTLNVYLDTRYRIIPRDFPLAYAEQYVGVSPFNYNNSRVYTFKGDTYTNYKLEYTENGIWHTKIDSVYVKSFETFTDTIYY